MKGKQFNVPGGTANYNLVAALWTAPSSQGMRELA